ncbi:hypothetical protein O181_047563 [Austropuccinia psidii MF-1]|uniref:Uncharacterized protein n=1 Tax=Austropuccinia psidii MF-1 TaxID=1389203 RepID=A0A9Q3HJM6_9BASI|nr:hypothetical protein [Austropuccinia psidii MF-1]
MAYTHGTATRMTVCVENTQHPLISDSGSNCSIVTREYLDKQFPNWEKKLLPTKAKYLKSTLGEMTSIWTIIKEINIPHRKGNIRLNMEILVLEAAHIQGFPLVTDNQRMYFIDIKNSENRHINIGTKKENKLLLEIYQLYKKDPLEGLFNELQEGQLSSNLSSKQKLSLIEIMRNNRESLALGENPWEKLKTMI